MFRLATALYLTVTGTMALRIMAGVGFNTEGIRALVSRQTSTNPAPPAQCATPCNAIEPIIADVSPLLDVGRQPRSFILIFIVPSLDLLLVVVRDELLQLFRVPWAIG